MNYLEQYYSNYDEEGRLLSKHGQVEYITTMKYIHDYLDTCATAKSAEANTAEAMDMCRNVTNKA